MCTDLILRENTTNMTVPTTALMRTPPTNPPTTPPPTAVAYSLLLLQPLGQSSPSVDKRIQTLTRHCMMRWEHIEYTQYYTVLFPLLELMLGV